MAIGPGRTQAQLAHFLNAVLILCAFAYALATYEGLPERFPVHFDATGSPDGWAEKSLAFWLLFPLMALGITGLMYVLSLIVNIAKKNPKLVNIPNKQKFLAFV